MNKEIIDFLSKQYICTLCYLDINNEPSCFSCFFVYHASCNYLLFKTSTKAEHSSLLRKNPKVSGTIHPNNLTKISTQGLQFKGVAFLVDKDVDPALSSFYHSKFPMALAINGEIWRIELEEVKLTYKRLNIGQTYTWSKKQA